MSIFEQFKKSFEKWSEEARKNVKKMRDEVKQNFEEFTELFIEPAKSGDMDGIWRNLESVMEKTMRKSEENIKKMLEEAGQNLEKMVKDTESRISEEEKRRALIKQYYQELVDEVSKAAKTLVDGYRESLQIVDDSGKDFRDLFKDLLEKAGKPELAAELDKDPLEDIVSKIKDWNSQMIEEIKEWEKNTLGSIGILPEDLDEIEKEKMDEKNSES